MSKLKIGIIGGTGFNDPSIFEDRTQKSVSTVFGEPSDALVSGKIVGVDVVLLPRHSKKHSLSPSYINYRANILALKNEGCTHILATTAVGSLKEEIKLGDMVFVDQLFDRTYKRETSFYDGKPGSPEGVCHIPMHEPFCPDTRKILQEASKELNIPFHEKGTAITIEGPRFSTKPESKFYQSLDGSVIGMTLCPEAFLAKEAGVSYACIAMVTDYDTWKENSEVEISIVLETMQENAVKAKKLILKAISKMAAKDWTDVVRRNQELVTNSIMPPDNKK